MAAAHPQQPQLARGAHLVAALYSIGLYSACAAGLETLLSEASARCRTLPHAPGRPEVPESWEDNEPRPGGHMEGRHGAQPAPGRGGAGGFAGISGVVSPAPRGATPQLRTRAMWARRTPRASGPAVNTFVVKTVSARASQARPSPPRPLCYARQIPITYLFHALAG